MLKHNLRYWNPSGRAKDKFRSIGYNSADGGPALCGPTPYDLLAAKVLSA
ncbi:MAG: hypothetical protein IIA67_03375 [Planctomycetes bacterium]|nr:hypothetical protein [Planctomycetota bacterium]